MSSSVKISVNPVTDAFLAVDVQPTFMPGGGLPVSGGDEIVPIAVEIAQQFPPACRYACLDKHQLGHVSLASSYHPAAVRPFTDLTVETVRRWIQAATDSLLLPHTKFSLAKLLQYLNQVGLQKAWPDHGLVGTAESEMHPDLAALEFRLVLMKGLDPIVDSYSAFKDNLGRPTGLAEEMRQNGVRRLYLVGLAFDFCVGASALDAAKAGFEVNVIMAGTRSVASDSAADMEKRLIDAGVHLL